MDILRTRRAGLDVHKDSAAAGVRVATDGSPEPANENVGTVISVGRQREIVEVRPRRWRGPTSSLRV
jgi:hypothetical protein